MALSLLFTDLGIYVNVNVKSNHPPNVLRDIPKSVNKRLSANSSTQKEFDEAKEPYQKALNESGYKHTLAYEEHAPAANGRSRGRKKSRDITWFNPPYNAAVVTDVGKQFLKLIDKHFTKKHPLGRLLNRNTVKISYSCTKNMKSIISSHNAKLLNSNEQEPTGKAKCATVRGGISTSALLTTTAKTKPTSSTTPKSWMETNKKSMWEALSILRRDGTDTQSLSGTQVVSTKQPCPHISGSRN